MENETEIEKLIEAMQETELAKAIDWYVSLGIGQTKYGLDHVPRYMIGSLCVLYSRQQSEHLQSSYTTLKAERDKLEEAYRELVKGLEENNILIEGHTWLDKAGLK